MQPIDAAYPYAFLTSTSLFPAAGLNRLYRKTLKMWNRFQEASVFFFTRGQGDTV
jgi:hypothetical protein